MGFSKCISGFIFWRHVGYQFVGFWPIQPLDHLGSEENLVVFAKKGDYTTQLYGEYNKKNDPYKRPVWWKVRAFFLRGFLGSLGVVDFVNVCLTCLPRCISTLLGGGEAMYFWEQLFPVQRHIGNGPQANLRRQMFANVWVGKWIQIDHQWTINLFGWSELIFDLIPNPKA